MHDIVWNIRMTEGISMFIYHEVGTERIKMPD